MASVTVTYQHGDHEDPDIEFDLAFEPADHNYGADADGNRGIYIPGYAYVNSEAPDKCYTCNQAYTAKEQEEIMALADKAAEDYEPDFDPPERDYDDRPMF